MFAPLPLQSTREQSELAFTLAAGDPDGDVLTIHAAPVRGEHVETLLFAFPMTDADSARLELRWGTTVVPFTIKAGR